jgi:hypothetical protein
VSARARRRALLALAALALGLMLALASYDARLRSAAAPAGIVSFELAGDAQRASRILDAWGPDARAAAAASLHLDFAFLAVYAPGLALLCAAASERERAAGSRLAAPGAALAWAQLAAGGLDAVENLALLRVLAGSASGAWPALAAACAWPKFAIVAAGLLYTGRSAAAQLLQRRRG